MTDADLHALALLLERLGLGLALVDASGQPRLSNRLHPAGRDARAGSITLHDGSRLSIAAPGKLTPTATHPPTHPAVNPTEHPSALHTPHLGDAETRFRLLAEHSTDLIIAVDMDLAIRYASPAATSLLGCDPADLHGHTLAELVVPEERAAFIARHFTRAASQGAGPELFQALRRDGSAFWVEARVAGLPPGNGLGDYLVTLRNAEQRRRNEQALGQANAELVALASTDALTGLPNRRQFDATLQKEWYRALRDGAPLGLLVIDVDHFKSINDLYGHQVGDRFLTRVAAAIRDSVRRAGDLAARFGGEEFAVVLPGTAVGGGLEIAETIRRAVAATDFGDIVPKGHSISVSIGVAASVPMGGAGATGLVQAADAALYQAKRNGRNRVEAMN